MKLVSDFRKISAGNIVSTIPWLNTDELEMTHPILYPDIEGLTKPEQMLQVVAIALDMNYDCYKMRSRYRNIVELRFIGALMLRMYFPRITLCQIAVWFGGLDHSSVINGINRATCLVRSGNLRFIEKYNKAVKSVDIWLKKEALDYASATSA